MSKVVRIVVGAVLTVAGVLTGNFALALAGAQLLTSGLFAPKVPKRAAASAQLQLGEQPRQAILGRAATAGSLVDAFNYGGKYGTDWEVLVLALADHRCDALEGFFVDDTYVAFSGDGMVAGFNNQLQVFWRPGTWDQTVPSILTTNGPGWTANDRGRGVAWVAVAYKADASDAKNPVFPSGRPRFRWVVRGLRCYQARKDSTVGGSGAHRWNNPATWEWTENPIDIRHNWVRGIYAGDRVNEPGMLLIGRGLSAIEAPPANVFPRANLCDELVGGQPRYRIGGVVASTEPFIDVETDFAAAVAGVISQPEGAVEVDPGQAKAPVAHFTDADLIVGSTVRWSEFLGQQDDGWINTVAARFVDPAQRWNVRGAPVRRELADVVADGGPREVQPQLDLVTNQPQAQRIAEVIRRLGRLWGRATVTLPPRFAFIEEGDWVTWQSDRRFGGATLTFRVEAWGSSKAWHHQLTLRQISASVYSDTAPLDDGVIASTQSPPPVVAAPAAGAWNAVAVHLDGGGLRLPAIRVTGASDDPAAVFVVVEYVQQVAEPGPATEWTFASSSRPEVNRVDVPAAPGGTFWVAVSYVVDGIQGARRVLGPVVTGAVTYPDGTPLQSLQPGEGGATRNVPRGTYAAGTTYVRGDIVLFSGSTYQLIVASSTGNPPPDVARWALIGNAGSGPPGADGLPGLTVIVSNEAHVVATAPDGSGGDYSAAGGQMRLLRGDTVLTPAFTIAAATPATGWISINASTGVYTVTDPGVDLATATIRASWAGVNYDRTYTLAKSKQGAQGQFGPTVTLVADAEAFTFTDGAPSPASQIITLSALLNNIGGTATWSVTPSVPLGGSGNTRTLSIADFGANRQVTVEATLGGITDRITVVRLERDVAAPGNANRVPFSRFEGGRGWSTLGGTFTTPSSPGPVIIDNRAYIWLEAASTAAGQTIFLGNNPRFPVIPLERLSVSSFIEVRALSGLASSTWQFYIEWLQGDTIVGNSLISSGTGNIFLAPRQADFVTVPSNANNARLVLFAQSTGAGTMRLFFLEPMITSAAAGQTAHPAYTPGPNAVDGATRNIGALADLDVVDAGGPLLIGQLPTDKAVPDLRNTTVTLAGLRSARPVSGAFIGQRYNATDTREAFRWDGFNWQAEADVTTTISGPADLVMQFRADLSVTSPLPLTADYQLGVAGASPLTSGVSWSVAVLSGTFAGAAPTITGSGTAQLRINSAMTSPEAELRVTASVAGRASPPFIVMLRRQVAPPTNAAFTSINSSSFAIAHSQPIQVQLPSGVSSVSLTAVADLLVNPEAPQGGTAVEGKWQRESSPGTWVDIGGTATSSPNPEVFFEEPFPGEGFFSATPGSITCNRTATGLTPGAIQRFRFVARISVGNVRTVTMIGNGNATT